MHPALLISFLGAFTFLWVQNRPFFVARPFVKAVMAIALCIYCLAVPNPPLWIMAVGFALSALGDFLLDLPDDKGFLPGLIAFAGAHIAFSLELIPYVTPYVHLSLWQIVFSLVLIIGSSLFYIWLYRDLPHKLRVPVFFYTGVIALMGCVAITTYLTQAMIIIVGALLFILSDMILAIARFKGPFRGDKTLNWMTYSLGQIFLAIGIVYALQCGICIAPFQHAG